MRHAISTGDLCRLAWHLGNRHVPAAIAADHILIREDRVIAAMLTGLGARLRRLEAPFTPEGGACGHPHHDRSDDREPRRSPA